MSRDERRRAGQRGPAPAPPGRLTVEVSRMDILTNYGPVVKAMEAIRARASAAQQFAPIRRR